MSDVALFDGLPYNREETIDHFTSDRLRAICEASTLQRFGLSVDAALEKARKRRAAQLKKAA
jgi:hypothetical protein